MGVAGARLTRTTDLGDWRDKAASERRGDVTRGGRHLLRQGGRRGRHRRHLRWTRGRRHPPTDWQKWMACDLAIGRASRPAMKGQILSSPGLRRPRAHPAPPADQRDLRCGRGLPVQHVGPRRIKRPPPVPGDVSRPCRWHLLHRGERRVVRVGRLRASGHRHHGGYRLAHGRPWQFVRPVSARDL